MLSISESEFAFDHLHRVFRAGGIRSDERFYPSPRRMRNVILQCGIFVRAPANGAADFGLILGSLHPYFDVFVVGVCFRLVVQGNVLVGVVLFREVVVFEAENRLVAAVVR